MLRRILVRGGLLVIAYGRAPNGDSGTRALELVAANVGRTDFRRVETVISDAGSVVRALA